jgi:hypothetical protein
MVLLPLLMSGVVLSTAVDDFERHIYPLANPQKSPRFAIDVSRVPETKAWAERSIVLARDWFPEICRLLATKDWKAPKKITFVFRPKQDAPAYASGSEISISSEWIKAHPEDFGMVIHELTHIVQSYPENKVDVGWLVEGIADYVRWWRYEPEAPRPTINKQRDSYRNGYRTTAAFLAWVSRRYDMRLVPQLDAKLRIGEDPMGIFKSTTGKTPDELWSEWVSTMKD